MKTWYSWVVLRRLLTASFMLLPTVLNLSALRADPPQAGKALGASKKSPQTEKAEQLVLLALQSEADGLSARRNAQLSRAQQVAPDFAPAHWHSGKVYLNQQWVDATEAQRQAAADPRFVQYQRLRDQYAGTLEGQVNLARWCRRQGLESQQQFHWLFVLSKNPANQEAQQALGVRLVAGRLLTSAEIVQQKEQQKQQRRLAQRLKPQIKRWLRQWKRGTPDEREAVLAEIGQWDQPLAIAQIESDLSGRHGEVSLAIVAALGRMDDDRATMSLVRHAVLSPFAEVRLTATGQLARRPMHDYVPTLMGQLKSPFESSYSVVPRGDGSVFYRHELYEQGPEQNQSKTFLGNFFQDGERRNYAVSYTFRPRTGQSKVDMRMLSPEEMRAIAREKQRRSMVRSKSYLAQALDLEHSLEQINQTRAEQNGRIAEVLAQVTDQYLGADPNSWWQWWRDYNELAPYEIPTYERTYTDWQYDRSVGLYHTLHIVPSCFPQGTLVWTRTGQQPIESVRMGDWVLAQEPDTGQLEFKPVLATTLREPSPLIEMTVDGKILRTTLGHPFWVNGKGWRMAKQLEAGDFLHTIRGSLCIDRVAETDPEEAYNLVVHDFATYFVGAAGILVHDNTIRKPTRSIVPGLAAR